MVSGIVTSVILETIILWKQMGPKEAFRTAVGMSMISMILMEAAMNLADYGMMGEPKITLAILPVTLGAGFLAAWPYNYSRSMASVVTDSFGFLQMDSFSCLALDQQLAKIKKS